MVWFVQTAPEHPQLLALLEQQADRFAPTIDPRMLQRECLYHLIGKITSHEFSAHLRPWLQRKCSPRQLHFELRENAYFALNLKFFCLRLASTKNLTGRVAARCCNRYCVNIEDGRLVYWHFRHDPQFCAEMAAFVAHYDRNALSWSALCTVHVPFDERYTELQGFIAYVVRKRLSFLLRPSNLERKDLYADLMIKGIKAYFTMVPHKYSMAYIFGCVKKAIDNHAINLIKRETQERRSRIYSVERTFVAPAAAVPIPRVYLYRVLSENQLQGNAIQLLQSGVEYHEHEHNREHDTVNKFLLQHSVQSLLHRYSTHRKKYAFLRLLLGKKSVRFSTWLWQKNLIKRREDNVEFQLRVPPIQYNDLVIEYLRIPPVAADRFLSTLRLDLS